MRICMRAALRGAALAGLAGLASPAFAHGVAGDRFFPATIATDDPLNADELSLPTVSRLKTGDEPSATETDISGEWSKRLTSKLGVSFSGDWSRIATPGLPAATGFQNPRDHAQVPGRHQRRARGHRLNRRERRVGRHGL